MSSKPSTLSSEEKARQKATAIELIEELEKSIARAQLMELFYQRRVISGDRSVQLVLGKTQGELKMWGELIDFLRDRIDK